MLLSGRFGVAMWMLNLILKTVDFCGILDTDFILYVIQPRIV